MFPKDLQSIVKYIAISISVILVLHLVSKDAVIDNNVQSTVAHQSIFRKLQQTTNKFTHHNDHAYKINSGNNAKAGGVPYDSHTTPSQHHLPQQPQQPQHSQQHSPSHDNKAPPPSQSHPQQQPAEAPSPHLKPHFEPPHIDAKKLYDLEFPTLTGNTTSSTRPAKVYYTIFGNDNDLLAFIFMCFLLIIVVCFFVWLGSQLIGRST